MKANQTRQWRARAAVAATIAVLASIAPAGRADATADFTFTRIAGDSRYATAAELALDSYTASSGAIIATGEAFPDALAASFIAGYVNAPILLVERNRVPDATKAALTKLEVKEVVLLGGTAAISEQVASELDETYEVVRLSGQDRFATAANIALAVNPGDIGEVDGKRTAFLTYGYKFADAMAVGPLAFAGRFPVLLNGSAGLGTPARVAIERLEIKRVVLVGGAISEAAEDQIEEMGVTTERLRGVDRFATATLVADFAVKRLGFVNDHVNLARGIDPGDPNRGFADALAGSVHAGREQAPLLLTHPTTLSPATHAWLEAHASQLVAGDILGGDSAVTATVKSQATTAARRVVGVVSEVDLADHQYRYTLDDSTRQVWVSYATDDRFTVDGEDATIDEFEAALTVGDAIRVTTAGGALHRLTNAD